jgi:hypothetical protein
MMSEPNINIKVKMINNIKNYSVRVNKNCPVEVLKQACAKKTLIPIESINIVFKGRKLDNNKYINEYHIENNDTIILIEDEENNNFNNLEKNFNNLFQGKKNTINITIEKMNPQMVSQKLNDEIFIEEIQNIISDENSMNAILNHPQIKSLIESNQKLKENVSNPQALKQMFSPKMMKKMNEMINHSKKKYKNKLLNLKEMGFENEDENYEILKRYEGDIQLTIDELINK